MVSWKYYEQEEARILLKAFKLSSLIQERIIKNIRMLGDAILQNWVVCLECGSREERIRRLAGDDIVKTGRALVRVDHVGGGWVAEG